MQGRLSPKINNKIQAFPLENWQNEFRLAKEIGFSSIEWIVEKPLNLNPLFSSEGLEQIKKQIKLYDIKIDYICADIFMQNPILNKEENLKKSKHLVRHLITSARKIEAKFIEIPFVDKSSLRFKNYDFLIQFFNSLEKDLTNNDMIINLETDLIPIEFKNFLYGLNNRIGANYDIGNSASLGYNFIDELNYYGSRIYNVHIKDRILNGATIDFGEGNANISKVLSLLSEQNYSKGLIIQGARGLNDIDTAKSQFDFTKNILNKLNDGK